MGVEEIPRSSKLTARKTMSDSDRLDRIEVIVEANSQQIATNSQEIAELRSAVNWCR